MRLLNHCDIEVGDWIVWESMGSWVYSKYAVKVEKITRDRTGSGLLYVWWDNGTSAWPAHRCRKVKGPDETTERTSGQAGAEI